MPFFRVKGRIQQPRSMPHVSQPHMGGETGGNPSHRPTDPGAHLPCASGGTAVSVDRLGVPPAVRIWRDRLVLTGWGFHLPNPWPKPRAAPHTAPSRLRPLPLSSVDYTQRRPPCSPAHREHITRASHLRIQCVGLGKERESSGGHGRAAPRDAGNGPDSST